MLCQVADILWLLDKIPTPNCANSWHPTSAFHVGIHHEQLVAFRWFLTDALTACGRMSTWHSMHVCIKIAFFSFRLNQLKQQHFQDQEKDQNRTDRQPDNLITIEPGPKSTNTKYIGLTSFFIPCSTSSFVRGNKFVGIGNLCFVDIVNKRNNPTNKQNKQQDFAIQLSSRLIEIVVVMLSR
jgi:hypothetical protein